MERAKSLSRRTVLTGGACLCRSLLAPSRPVVMASGNRFCLNSEESGWETSIEHLPSAYAREGPDQAAIVVFLDAENDLLGRFFGLPGEYRIVVGSLSASYRSSKDLIYLGEKRFPQRTDNFHRISAIFAHEAAHRFQVKHGIAAQLMQVMGFPVKYVELHADYMAGAYMAATGGKLDIQDIFFELGDLNVLHSDHHGLKPERFNAFHRGFRDYRKIAAKYPNDTLAVAFGGIKYVQCIPPDQSGSCSGI
jgi:hypothetical protein